MGTDIEGPLAQVLWKFKDCCQQIPLIAQFPSFGFGFHLDLGNLPVKVKMKLDTAQVLQLFWPAASLPSLVQDPYVAVVFFLSLSPFLGAS